MKRTIAGLALLVAATAALAPVLPGPAAAAPTLRERVGTVEKTVATLRGRVAALTKSNAELRKALTALKARAAALEKKTAHYKAYTAKAKAPSAAKALADPNTLPADERVLTPPNATSPFVANVWVKIRLKYSVDGTPLPPPSYPFAQGWYFVGGGNQTCESNGINYFEPKTDEVVRDVFCTVSLAPGQKVTAAYGFANNNVNAPSTVTMLEPPELDLRAVFLEMIPPP